MVVSSASESEKTKSTKKARPKNEPSVRVSIRAKEVIVRIPCDNLLTEQVRLQKEIQKAQDKKDKIDTCLSLIKDSLVLASKLTEQLSRKNPGSLERCRKRKGGAIISLTCYKNGTRQATIHDKKIAMDLGLPTTFIWSNQSLDTIRTVKRIRSNPPIIVPSWLRGVLF